MSGEVVLNLRKEVEDLKKYYLYLKLKGISEANKSSISEFKKVRKKIARLSTKISSIINSNK